MHRNTRGTALYTAILLMIATAVAGAAPAKQGQNPSQAGQSSVYFYNVAASGTHGPGKLMIDVAKHTFEFNGQDFEPSAQVQLRARAADSAEFVSFATGKPNPSGNVHLAGKWEAGAPAEEVVADMEYQGIAGFYFDNEGYFVAQLACYFSTDGGATWLESRHIDGIAIHNQVWGELGQLGVPQGALVKIHVEVVAGKDRTGSGLFQYEAWESFYAEYKIYGATWNPNLEYIRLVSKPTG
jgi:hypothetical protein